MIAASWISGKYFPGGQALFVGFYNTFVHFVMYCYYLITSINPNYRENVWWKKYVTLVQIVSILFLKKLLTFSCKTHKNVRKTFENSRRL